MAWLRADQIVVIGAGSAGLMAARELGRAGKRVTILEARNRCGRRIHPLPAAEFGYPAESGAEFVHGEAPVTRGLLREAGLSPVPVQGTRWKVVQGAFSRDDATIPTADLAAAKNRAGRLRSTMHAFSWTAPTACDGRNEARRKDWRL